MDSAFISQLDENGLIYRQALERIICKYSKLQYQEGALEVDLDEQMDHYMELTETNMSRLESQSLGDLTEEPLRPHDVTRDSQSDIAHQDSEPDETCVSTSQFFVEDDGMLSDSTQLTVSSSEESQRNVSETELQPEDQDEELEMSLRSQGTSLLELYPSMIIQIGRAWHRQHVSNAADSVLRRYQRWRRLSNRSNLNNTFHIIQRHSNSNPKKMTSEILLEGTFNKPLKRQFPGIYNRGAENAPKLSPLRKVTSLQDWHTPKKSPGRARGTLTREQHQPVLVMDVSHLSETLEPIRSLLNETFTVTQLSPPSFSQPSLYVVSPSRPHYPSAKASSDLGPRLKMLPLSAHSAQTAGCSTYALETTGVKERSNGFRSPVRQSPLKARIMNREGLGRSPPPHAFSRNPKSDSASYSREPMSSRSMATFLSSPPRHLDRSPPPQAFSRSPKSDSVSYSREPMSSRSMATFLSSPPRQPVKPLRMLHPQDSHHSFQSQLHSPLSVTAAGRHMLRRHLSFDSSLPRSRVSYSQKEIEEDYAKLYHKFVCQNKSSHSNSPSCRLCARSSEASRGHSSSALAALALSPHRSILRKRRRELDWDCHPQSKRSRDGYCTYSPGSERHGKEMQRCRPSSSVSEPCYDGFSTKQPSADAHQAALKPRGWPVPAAEFSGLGGSLENKMAAGSSSFPRKW